MGIWEDLGLLFVSTLSLADLIENARGSSIQSLAEIEFGSCWLIPTSVVDRIQL